MTTTHLRVPSLYIIYLVDSAYPLFISNFDIYDKPFLSIYTPFSISNFDIFYSPLLGTCTPFLSIILSFFGIFQTLARISTFSKRHLIILVDDIIQIAFHSIVMPVHVYLYTCRTLWSFFAIKDMRCYTSPNVVRLNKYRAIVSIYNDIEEPFLCFGMYL